MPPAGATKCWRAVLRESALTVGLSRLSMPARLIAGIVDFCLSTRAISTTFVRRLSSHSSFCSPMSRADQRSQIAAHLSMAGRGGYRARTILRYAGFSTNAKHSVRAGALGGSHRMLNSVRGGAALGRFDRTIAAELAVRRIIDIPANN